MRTVNLALLLISRTVTRTVSRRIHRARLARHIRHGHDVAKEFPIRAGSTTNYYHCSCGKGWVR